MALRSKSQKRLLILLTAAVATVGGLGGFYLYRKDKLHRALMAELPAGLDAYKHGETVQTLQLLGDYLRNTNSDDIAAHEAYVNVRLALPDKTDEYLADVNAQYQRLIALKPDNLEYKYALLKVYSQRGLDTEAVELADAILKKNPKDVTARQRETAALMGLRKYADYKSGDTDHIGALNSAKLTLETDPLAPVAAKQVMACMFNMGQPGTAIESWGLQQIKGHEGDPGAALIEAMMYAYSSVDCTDDARQDKIDRQNAALKEVFNEKPKSAEIAGYVVELMDVMGWQQQATQYLDKNRADLNDETLTEEFYRRLAYAGDFARIEKELSDPARHAEESTLLTALRCMALAENKKFDQARPLLDVLKERGQRWDYSAEDWRQVLSMIYFNEVPADGAGGKVRAPRQRDLIEAVLAASQRKPKEAFFQMFLGDAYAHSGDAAAAIGRWENTKQLAPSWARPWMQLATLFEATNEPERALAQARAADLLQPNQPDIMISVVRAWNASLGLKNTDLKVKGADSPENMLKLLEQIRTQFPREEAILPLQVEIQVKLYTDHMPQAKALIAQDIALKPALSEATLLHLAAISNENKMGMEEECIAASEKAHGQTAEAAWTRAALLKVSDYDAAKAYLKKARDEGVQKALAEKAAASDPAVRADLDITIESWGIAWGRLLESKQDPEAVAAWQDIAYVRGTKNLTDDTKVLWALLNAPSVWKDHAFTGEVLEKLKALNGDSGLSWRLEKARWLLDDRSRDSQTAAQKLLAETVRLAPTSPDVRELWAKAYGNAENYASAAAQMATAADLDTHNLSLKLEAAQMLLRQGEYVSAANYLNAVAEASWATDNQRLRAAVLLAQIPTEAAASTAMKLLESPAKDGDGKATLASIDETGGAALTLASLYWQIAQQGPSAAAPDNYKRAFGAFTELLKKPTPDIIEQAAAFFQAIRKTDEAEKAIAQLATIKVDPGRRHMIEGRYQAQMGNNAKAVDLLRQAVKESPTLAEAWRWLEVTLLTETPIVGKDGKLTDLGKEAVAAAGQVEGQLETLRGNVNTLKTVPTTTAQQLADATGQFDLMQALAEDPVIKALAQNTTAVPKILGDDDARMYLVSCLLVPQDAKGVAEVIKTYGSTKPEEITRSLKIQAERNENSLALQILVIRKLVYGNQVDEALNVSKRAMISHPSAPMPAFYASTCETILGKWDDALADAERWKTNSSNDSTAPEMAISRILVSMQRGNDAENMITDYLKKNPAGKGTQNYREMLYLMISAMVQEGKVQEAAATFWPEVVGDPNLADAWARIGADYVPGAKASEDWLKRQEDVTPASDLEGQMRVGLNLFRLGVRLKAPLMLPADPQAAEAQRNAGVKDVARGFEVMEKAMHIYDKPAADAATQLQHVQMTARAAFLLAGAYDMDDDLPNAEKYYRLTVSGDSRLHPAYNNLAMVLAREETESKLPEAVQFANLAIAAQGNVPAYYDTLSFVLVRQKNYDKALQALDTAIKLEPTNPLWEINYMDTQLKAGKVKDAEVSMKKLEDQYHFDPSTFPADMKERYNKARVALKRPPV